MTDRTDDLLISVSTDLSTIKRQLKQLGQDVGQATSGVQRQFDAMGKGIDASMTPIQKRINAMVGLPVGPRLKEWQGALSGVEGGSKITANQLLNLSRQGNDVITMFALGAKPMQIFASQAGQIFDALQSGPAGVMGSIKALGEGAIGLATKFPLVTAAVAAAGVAFIAYEAVGGSNLKTLDEITKTHEGNIKLLGDAWDEASAKKKNYAALSVNSVVALNEKDVQNAKDLLSAQIKGILDQLYKTIGAGGGNQFALSKSLISTFEPFRQAIEDLARTSDVKTFISQIDQIAEVNPKLSSTRDELKALALEAANTAAAIPGLSQPVDEMGDTIDKFNRAMASVTSEPLQKTLQDIFNDAKDGKSSIDEINAAIAALEQANPSFAGILQGLRNIAIEARGASQAVADAYAKAAGSSPNGRVYNPLGAQVDDAIARGANIIPTPAPNREDLGAEYDKAVAAAQRKADAAARRANRAQPKTADDRFAEDLQSIRDRTAALTEEYNSLGLSYEAQTKRKTALDLEQQALKQVREEARKKGDTDWQNAQLTPDQIAKIDAVSEAYARQADELRKAQEMYDLQKDVIKGAFDDLRSALDDGKLDWQDFGKIAEGVLDKIIDKIENDLVDAIMQASSSGGVGGGWLGSILGAVTGGGGGSDPGIIGALGLRANGGPVTAGQPYIVGEKRAELFIPNTNGMILPQVPSIQSGGGSSQSNVITFAPTIQMQGGGKDAGEQVTAALKKFEKEFTPRVVKSLREAKTRGMA
ncbi:MULTISPECIES: phage tail length tape measure family protein [unclassified Mesorhizobium]|uniref:phage tail length tape measure family protein n=1 Tax=unclassified Mesorhizobium TaxID=325217 RepID=UPI000FDAB632|nr:MULTISPECIES: phage tail length tape measure family protein [unclassified Mesorhizobium]TGR58255.1 hypothetical protein EN842_01295 [bacterium M00.F.Ca.ET.199.01.1.1]TGU41637.1 hypothetical protein EN799_03520 [bacterium M00.F.Ca.ET.156.01.1.1]TGV89739.1 hypothetical protein EN792_006165 [Mesorhizobium sp. M00.F.Ca.ET.149.01.1.1]TGR32997.1 hypothetical protein EN840_01295 [Mesorhizobium sp. M8A.F.Ca.ET.197.01.1.1]TGR34643.1 hypothetical protein EN845_01295 [Mesorhizobium sp. M8A.F.Ca.ET.202